MSASRERFVAAREIFDQLVDLPREQWAEKLSELCANNPALQAEVEELLAGVDATLSTPGDPADGRTAPAGPQIEGYELTRELSRGGQGVVYQAVQKSTKRRVAIKVMKEGPFVGPADRARFEREVQVLGQLQHPNIVTIHDSGAAAGSFYFVMDYISGRALDEHVLLAKPSIDDTLRLFAQICDAVNAAHLRGVIHRDLKPGNIRIDPEGQPHVLDFGLAKIVTGEVTEGTRPQVMSLTGQFFGSLPWASPEQAEAVPSKIDIRTDVYSLGVILYYLLTGRFPYEVVGNMHDVLDNILKAVPARPSTIRLAAGGRAGRLNDEIDTIVLKCLSKERERRYQSAGELARDVRHYLAGEPIEAKRDSGWYVLKKSLRRYRAAVITAAAFLVLLVGSAATSTALYLRSENEARNARRAESEQSRARKQAEDALEREVAARAEAEHEREKAEAINKLVTTALVSSDPNQGGTQGFLVTGAMEQAIELLDAGELKDQPETDAALRLTIAQILNGNARPQRALHVAEQALAINREFHLGDHPDIAVNLSHVAVCLDSLGRSAEALPKHEAALEMLQRLSPGDDSAVANSLNNVAYCLDSLGRSQEALPKYEAAAEMLQRLFPGDHPHVATSLNNVASCVQRLGRPAEALPKYEAALEMKKRIFPGDHPDVALGLNNVGVCLYSLGKWAEALPEHEAALEMRQRLFEGDHAHVALSLNNVASCLNSLGRRDEALPRYEAALEMYQRLFPDDHPSVAQALMSAGGGLVSLGRPEEALPKLNMALDMFGRLFPGDHPLVAASLSSVGHCLESLGQPAEALSRHEAALEMRQRLFPGNHRSVATSLNNAATCLYSLGRPAEALPKFEAALAMFHRILPAGHPRMLYPQIGLSRTLAALGRHADAEPLLADAVEQCERSEPSRRMHWRGVLRSSVELYDAWHAAEPDKGHDTKAAEWRAKLEQWQATTRPAATQPA
ncbi:MAG: serine/threonine-protein kinase [Planctomycetes bacterium]|nr:serine/threonine-protein kinase [Planctomycetota bacterium]